MKTAKQAELICRLYLISRARKGEAASLKELEQKLGYTTKTKNSNAHKLLRFLVKQKALTFSHYDFATKTERYVIDEDEITQLLRTSDLFRLFYEVIYERSAYLVDDTPHWDDIWESIGK